MRAVNTGSGVCGFIDKDECAAGLCGQGAASCSNLGGTYKCTCKDGYEEKHGTCLGLVFLSFLLHVKCHC